MAVGLGPGERLRRVLVADVGVGQRVLVLAHQPGCVGRDLGDANGLAEHDLAAAHRGRVAEVDDADRPQGLVVGPFDQIRPAPHEHLDGHVVGMRSPR